MNEPAMSASVRPFIKRASLLRMPIISSYHQSSAGIIKRLLSITSLSRLLTLIIARIRSYYRDRDSFTSFLAASDQTWHSG